MQGLMGKSMTDGGWEQASLDTNLADGCQSEADKWLEGQCKPLHCETESARFIWEAKRTLVPSRTAADFILGDVENVSEFMYTAAEVQKAPQEMLR